MKYIVKKIATLIITLLIVTFLTFLAFDIIPGDQATTALGIDATNEQVEAYRQQLGLNDPIPVRYGRWLVGILQGDFGISGQYSMPVSQVISERLPVTIGLAILSILFIIICSIPLGVQSAKSKKPSKDGVFQLLTQMGMAIPSFFLGMLLTLIFGILLQWFTPGKYIDWRENFLGYLSCLLFPAIAIAIPKIAMTTRFLRTSILRQLRLDYVRTARSKGLTLNKVLYRHVLKNACIPVITFLALVIAEVLAGSIVVEQVFNLPGLGRLFVVSISNRDFPVVQAIVLYIAVVVFIMNFLVDVAYGFLDPRVNE